MMTTKEKLLNTINTVVRLSDYDGNDCIFSEKYPTTPTNMVYILQRMAKDFQFAINDDFVDALEMCTFARLEELLEKYTGTGRRLHSA